MKRLPLAIWILAMGLGLNAQDCPSAFKPYTTAEYIYSCQSDIDSRGNDAHALTQGLCQDALNSLAKQFEVRVESKAVSKLLSVDGNSKQAYSSMSELTTDVTLRLAHTKEYYDPSRKKGWAIAYINKMEARHFYQNEYTQAISIIRTIIAEADALIARGLKARARSEKLPEAEAHFQTAYEALAWLNLFGYPEADLQTLLDECSLLRQQMTAMMADLEHGVAIYLQCSATMNSEPYRGFASEVKGRMEKAGCHFVENAEEADWIVVANAEVIRTQHFQNMAYFCWIDGHVTITNAVTSQVIYENRISDMEDGHPDGIKGNGDTRAYEPSARDGYREAARIVAEKCKEIITQ